MNLEDGGLTALVHLFFEAGMLRTTRRSHCRRLLTRDDSDNIASHSFRVAIIAWFLAKFEGADPEKALMMGLLHDFPEARTGDADWVQRAYVHEDEERVAREQFQRLPFGSELLGLLLEALEKESPEARVAKDADYLDQLLLQKEYAHQGNREAEKWLRLGDFENKNALYKRLNTESARRLALEIIRQEPGDWWEDLWVADKS